VASRVVLSSTALISSPVFLWDPLDQLFLVQPNGWAGWAPELQLELPFAELVLDLPLNCPQVLHCLSLNSWTDSHSSHCSVGSKIWPKVSSCRPQRDYWLSPSELQLWARYRENTCLQQDSYPRQRRVILETCLCLGTSKHLVTLYFIVTRFGRNVSDLEFPQQPIGKFIGNRLVDADFLDVNLLPSVTEIKQKWQKQVFSLRYAHSKVREVEEQDRSRETTRLKRSKVKQKSRERLKPMRVSPRSSSASTNLSK
jgi:hypothetical protein